jgi:17beta-estradiol 17-dehydrogenase / very-long-chain 3-oxoacyl-CoA reductase
MSASTVAAAIGYLCIAWLLRQTILFLSFHFWTPSTPLLRYRREKPAYALITGSSGGIGLGLAQELLNRGFGVVLLAHKKDELEAAKIRLQNATSTATSPEIHILHINAVTVTDQALQQAVSSVGHLPITILINNVGGLPVSAPHFRHVWEYNPSEIDDTINMNSRFMSQLSRLMMPILARNGPSLIINLSSAGQIGLPWLTMYSATKAYDAAFSRALARDAKAAGLPVDCVAIIPGDVHSEGNTLAVPRGSPTSAEFAKMVLDRIDTAVSRGMLEICPYWLHALQWLSLDWVPQRIIERALVERGREKRDAYNKAE